MGINDDIRALEMRIDDYRRQVELLQAELKGMMAAKRYLDAANSSAEVDGDGANKAAPAPSMAKEPGPSKNRGGRQPGAISKRWQVILGDLYGFDFGISEVVRTVQQLEGRDIKPAEVRRQFDVYAQHGLVAENADGTFFVTDKSAQKYGFKAPPKTEEGRDERPSLQNDGGEMVRSDGYPPARSGGSIPPTSTGMLPSWSSTGEEDEDIPF